MKGKKTLFFLYEFLDGSCSHWDITVHITYQGAIDAGHSLGHKPFAIVARDYKSEYDSGTDRPKYTCNVESKVAWEKILK